MKEMDLLKEILAGSKEYSFEYGNNGMTVLKIKGYYTGKTIKLDLSYINEEMLSELLVVEDEEDYN